MKSDYFTLFHFTKPIIIIERFKIFKFFIIKIIWSSKRRFSLVLLLIYSKKILELYYKNFEEKIFLFFLVHIQRKFLPPCTKYIFYCSIFSAFFLFLYKFFKQSLYLTTHIIPRSKKTARYKYVRNLFSVNFLLRYFLYSIFKF